MGQRKYPTLTLAEVEAILRSLKFEPKRQVGSHSQWERSADALRPRSLVTVDTALREFNERLLKSMIRQSNFSRDQFYGATKRTALRASVPRFLLSTSTEID